MSKAGTFIAQLDPHDDVAMLLGTDVDEVHDKLDERVVQEEQWSAWQRVGLLDEWQQIAEGLLGPFEEAWFQPPALEKFLASAERARAALTTEADADAKRALDDVVMLAANAHRRNVPVIFAG